jgi:uncharacterized protein
MKLDLSEILANVGMHMSYHVEEPPIVAEEIRCVQPVTGELVFTNTGEALVLRGTVESAAALECSRCLVEYPEPVSATIEEAFALKTGTGHGRTRQTQILIDDEDDMDTGILFSGPLFDLTELLRQSLVIDLPIKPLHDEDCKGLCPMCGADRNVVVCNCAPPEGHPGMGRLAELLTGPVQ